MTFLTDTGSELPADLLESVCVTKNCASLDVDVALPAITGVMSSAVFDGGGGRC